MEKGKNFKGRVARVLFFVLFLGLVFGGNVALADTAENMDMGASMQAMDQESRQIERLCETPEGEAMLRENLMQRFAVTNEQITELRNRGLGFGEIGTLYSFSEASGKDSAELLRMRVDQGMGWGKIAAQVNTPMNRALQAMKGLRPSQGQRVQSQEQMREGVRTKVRKQEQMGSPEKMQMPERPQQQKTPMQK